MYNYAYYYYDYFIWHCSSARAMASSSTRFLDHTQRRATVGRTSLDEWSARHRDLYLTTHNKHPCPGGIRTHDRSRLEAVDLRRAAIGTDIIIRSRVYIYTYIYIYIYIFINTNKRIKIITLLVCLTDAPTCFGTSAPSSVNSHGPHKLLVGVHYRSNNGIPSEVTPVCNFALWV
jgi:hypothetical protein